MKDMDKNKIKEFFNGWASRWDDDMVKDDGIMNLILDNAEVSEGKDILDVACGTGVMIDYYLERGVRSVTGIDFSERMCEIASAKYGSRKNVRIVCADIEEYTGDIRYDAIIVYNSFPHFPDGERLISHLASLLKKGGVLTVAHGMSRDRINAHHSNVSEQIKCELMEADELAGIISNHLKVTSVISDDKMYQVAGKRSTE